MLPLKKLILSAVAVPYERQLAEEKDEPEPDSIHMHVQRQDAHSKQALKARTYLSRVYPKRETLVIDKWPPL